jgi:hypothetical protein
MKGMTCEQFDSATYYVQKTMIEFHATPLLKRSTGNIIVELFQLNDFYVEVSILNSHNNTALIKSVTVDEIDLYLAEIDISAICHLLK